MTFRWAPVQVWRQEPVGEQQPDAGPAAVEAVKPRLGLAVLACTDPRIDPLPLLGLKKGDAQVLRNAGAVVTDDVLRTLALGQHLAGTWRIAVVQHTGCEMHGRDPRAVADAVRDATGRRPEWRYPSSADAGSGVRDALAALRGCPYLLRTDQVRGFVHDLDGDGSVREIH